jgi:hypothetical protein
MVPSHDQRFVDAHDHVVAEMAIHHENRIQVTPNNYSARAAKTIVATAAKKIARIDPACLEPENKAASHIPVRIKPNPAMTMQVTAPANRKNGRTVFTLGK